MSKTTTDHDEIRRWAEQRGAAPAAVEGTGDKGHEPDAGLLRLEFRDNDNLDEVDWDAFFRTFDDRELAFLYEEDKDSRFNKFVRRDG